ncbi:MAG TPA: hypothetical protein DHW82_12940 [Spirochaetia bacterium]|nr:MAG: hypothetical protein A2Y41_04400 [Spirochaetes bacterium GWB1_36_13]HCL57896.1 hypothetical protein [Spirochaetia bacterium]
MIDKKDNNARTDFRVPTPNLLGEYVYKGIKDTCQILDLSFNGAGIKIPQIVAEDDIVDIRFTLEKYGKIYFKGKVTSSRGGKVGVLFFEIPEKSRKSIQKFIEDFTNQNISRLIGGKFD